MTWDREKLWKARRALRFVVMFGCCFAATTYALEQTQGALAGLLVIAGVIAVGMGWAKIWPEPDRPK